jgi:hypothetical protein
MLCWDSISRSITPVSSQGGDDTTGPRRQGKDDILLLLHKCKPRIVSIVVKYLFSNF